MVISSAIRIQKANMFVIRCLHVERLAMLRICQTGKQSDVFPIYVQQVIKFLLIVRGDNHARAC